VRLESLKIQGFKSFADKVELVFKPGITAIVGPNGCGKSNITDAIRWVLGEQSARALRGGQMEDVIFNGSACQPAKGMAEVSLKLTNLGSLPIAFQEVVITRRIFRSGENEYLINKTPCRLKDIVDLFLDTGLGKGAYSIVEQGKIDFIIMAKPKERRSLIESAAGILKYKSKREEALKKMEATEQNLERIRDILHEVEKQKDTLAEQAKMAIAYKEYRRQEDELSLKIARGQYLILEREKAKLNAELRQWKDKEMATQAQLAQDEAEIEKLKTDLLEYNQQISTIQKAIYELESQINSHIQQQQTCERELKRLEEERAAIGLEQEELHASQSKIEAESRALEAELEAKEQSLAERGERLKELEKDYLLLGQNIQKKSQLYEIRRKDIFGLSNQEARLENFCTNLKGKQKELRGKQEGLEKTLARLEDELRRKDNRKRELQQQIEQQKGQLEELRQQEEEVSERMRKASEELKETELRIRALDRKFQAASSLLKSLEEIFERKEGYQESVRHLLLAKKTDQPQTGGLLGVVAELMSVPATYERAIESVLEHDLQSMVVKSFEDGLRLLQYLTEHKIGRGTFIALEAKIATCSAHDLGWQQQSRPEPAADLEQAVRSLDIQGVRGLAIKLIQYDKQYEKVISYLLGRTIIVDDLPAAKELLAKLAGDYQIVTLGGEILSSWGIISGGEAQKSSPSLLARKREMEELRILVPLLQSNIEQEEAARNQKVREMEELRAEKEGLGQRRHKLEIALSGLQKDLFHLEREFEQEQQRVKEIGYKKERALLDERQMLEELKTHEAKLDKLREEKAEAEQEIKTLAHELDTLRQQEKELQEQITEAKITLTSLKEHLAAQRAALRHQQELRVQNSKRIDQLQSRLEKIALDWQTSHQTIHKLHSQLPQLVQERETASLDFQRLETARSEKAESLRELEKKLKKTSQSKNQILMEIKKIELQLAEIEVRMSHIVEGSHLSDDPIPLSADDGALLSEEEIRELQEQLQKTRSMISSLGAVNLMAIEEYQQLVQRYEFLHHQENDMRTSLEALNSLINRINQDSSERFKQAFESINLNFQAAFKRLFEGGHAELLLEEPNDLLETGVEVVAQPPGKKPQYLSLLSGGEKALTAIALILAIYLLKPSPFCLLDEIDAPLDDANIDRFLSIINEFKQRTQFLIITHNKKTMQMADAIYGVTIERPGISKVVSLELNNCITAAD